MAVKSYYLDKIKFGNEPSDSKRLAELMYIPLQRKMDKILENHSPEAKQKTFDSYTTEEFQSLLRIAWGLK
jgi:hypothetical protein